MSLACVIRCSFLSTDWVVKLGPASFGKKNLYQYAVVTDNFQIGLYVLARDVNNFRSQYDKEVLSWLAENGFTHFYNKPVATVQNEKCLYPGKSLSISHLETSWNRSRSQWFLQNREAKWIRSGAWIPKRGTPPKKKYSISRLSRQFWYFKMFDYFSQRKWRECLKQSYFYSL